ncbi:hypothetical protein LTR08_007925 [Meristemomyces frigidus]|nr:hypothetical protein LTR08_007925 [Meristemomyces frigidus]
MAFHFRALHLRLLLASIFALAAVYFLYPSFISVTTSNGISTLNITNETSLAISDPNNGTADDLSFEEKIKTGDWKLGYLIHEQRVDGVLVSNDTFWGEDAKEQYEQHVEKKEKRELEERAFGYLPMLPASLWTLIKVGELQIQPLVELYLACLTNKLVADLERDPLQAEPPYQRPVNNAWSLHSSDYWTTVEYNNGPGFPELWMVMARAVSSLQVGSNPPILGKRWTVLRHVLTTFAISAVPGPNKAIFDTQDKFPVKTHMTEATNAQYHMVMNIIDGVVIIQSALSPLKAWEQQNPGQVMGDPDLYLPPMRQLSDRIWYHWMRIHNEAGPVEGPSKPTYGSLDFTRMIPGVTLIRTDFIRPRMMKTFLNWIALEHIQDSLTGSVVSSCLYSRGFDPLHPGPPWGNHQTFGVGDWCFYALLGLPINKGIAWLLAQHKTVNTLGHKVLKSVTIFFVDVPATASPERAALAQLPCLIWEVVDFYDDLRFDKVIAEAPWYQLEHAARLPASHYPPI